MYTPPHISTPHPNPAFRIVMKKTVHTKTVIGVDGQQETIVIEDASVEHDDSLPLELQDSVKQVINEFVE